jgi:hypothetical protein
MTAIKQEKKLAIGIVNPQGSFVRIGLGKDVRECEAGEALTIPLEAARELHQAIGEAIESCNVATHITPKTALFDTCVDKDVYVLELDNKTLTDFQTLRNSVGEDIRKTIIALMDYYSNQDQLNIILLADALEKRQSYIKFTAQLANYLTHNQTNYSQCKVQFDHLTTRLGIFCRKGTEKSALNSNFLGSVTAALRAYGSCEVDTADVPMSYLGNRAALKHLLTTRLGKTPRIIWTKDNVKIFEKSK